MVKSFADGDNKTSQSKDFSSSDVKSAEIKIDAIMEEFAKYIENNNITSLDDKKIDLFFNSKLKLSEQITGQELYAVMTQSKNQVSNMKAKNYSDEEIAKSQCIKTIIANDKIKINILNNGLFTLEEIADNDTADFKEGMTRASKTSSARVDYKAWTGWHVFTASAIGTFSYNGSKCTLQNGSNNSYIKRGFLSVWQVSDKKVEGGTSGTSAFAKISANLHMGLEINGVGLVIQDVFVSHKVTVNKAGGVNRQMIPGPAWSLG